MINNLPYQKHSKTSRNAAESNVTANAHRDKIYNLIKDSGFIGCISDHLAKDLKLVPNAVASRLGELEQDKKIVRLEDTRKTRSNRNANIYVLPEYVAGRNVLSPKEKNSLKEMQKEIDRLRDALEKIANSKDWFIQSRPFDLVKIAKDALH